jgi:hypothetical protein
MLSIHSALPGTVAIGASSGFPPAAAAGLLDIGHSSFYSPNVLVTKKTLD